MKPADTTLAVAAPPKKARHETPKRGVHSEVGVLRSVIVCRPGLAHLRLTPRSCTQLHFDSVLWFEQAQRDFAQFVRVLAQRGIEVLELHDLLAQTLAAPEARRWLLDHQLPADAVGPDLLEELHAALLELPAAALAEMLLGGLTKAELPFKPTGLAAAFLEVHDFVLPPLPNALFMRDASSWIGNGVSLNALLWPTRRRETLLMDAVYRFHPRFHGGTARWQDAAARDSAAFTLEGGDIMPLGDGVLLVAFSERSTPQAAMRLARRLFDSGTARAVVTARLPASAAARHLDTVFTQAAPDVVTYLPEVVDRIVCHELRPGAAGQDLQLRSHAGKHMLDVLSEVLQAPTFNALSIGDARFDGTPEQWDDGNGVLALEPGVVVSYDRNGSTNKRLRQAGLEVIEIPGGELGRAGAGPHALCCPLSRERLSYR
jgi:arginine deiminase